MLGPGAQLSGAQLSALKKWTVGPPGQLGPGEMYKINWHLFPKCGRHISNIYITKKYTFPNPAPKGRTENLQLTYIPQMLAAYIWYKYICYKMYIPKPCARRVHRRPPTDMYPPKCWHIYASWRVSMDPLSWWMYILQYIFVLDINCQHLGSFKHWRVSVRPSGAGFGNIDLLIYREFFSLVRPYFIFVTFFTQPQFEAGKFYTWKCVNSRQKLPHDKTA